MSKNAVDWYRIAYDFQVKKGDHRSAFDNYKKAAETDPKYANAYFGMASC
jgi:Tfp pilus assembly protein PilF